MTNIANKKYTTLGFVAAAVMFVGMALPTASAEAMNKAELIDAIASEAGLSKAHAKKALEGLLPETTNAVKALKKGDRLSLVGFGSFSVSKRAASQFHDQPTIVFSPDVRSTGAKNRHQGETVTGEDLVRNLDEKCSNERKRVCPDYGAALAGLLTATEDALAQGEVVEWGEFGTFTTAVAKSISKRSARTGRNPQTGKEIQIAAKNTVKFKAGAELSKAVN